jgi:hypothetical protein
LKRRFVGLIRRLLNQTSYRLQMSGAQGVVRMYGYIRLHSGSLPSGFSEWKNSLPFRHKHAENARANFFGSLILSY